MNSDDFSKKTQDEVKGKAYQTIDVAGYTLIRDSEWAVNHLRYGTELLAEAISKAREAREVFDLVQQATEDNGDPVFESEQAIVKLAEALATANDYRKEYQDEIDKPAAEEEPRD